MGAVLLIATEPQASVATVIGLLAVAGGAVGGAKLWI
jgi:hypothetical protein